MAGGPDRRKLLRAIMASAAAGASNLSVRHAVGAAGRTSTGHTRTSRVAPGCHEGPPRGGAFCHCGDRFTVGSASADGFPLGVWSHGGEETAYT